MKKILSALLTAALLLALLALAGCGSKDSLTLNVYNWGEYISDGSEGSLDTIKAFEKWYEAEYGQKVKVNYSTYASNEDMYAKLSSGAVSYDVIIPSDYMIARMISENMLLKIRTGETDEVTGEEKLETKEYSLISFSVFYEDFHELIAEQKDKGIIEEYDYKQGFTAPWWLGIIPYLLLFGVMIWLWYSMMNNQGGAGGVARFSKARTRLGSEEKNKKTFADVAGCDEEKEELAEIVDFLKDPKAYTAMGWP